MCRSVEFSDFVEYALCRFPEVRIPLTVLDGPLLIDRVLFRSGSGRTQRARAGVRAATDSIKTSTRSPDPGPEGPATPWAQARSHLVPPPGQGLDMADSRFCKGS